MMWFVKGADARRGAAREGCGAHGRRRASGFAAATAAALLNSGCATLGLETTDLDSAPPGPSEFSPEEKGRFERFWDAVNPFPAPEAYAVAFEVEEPEAGADQAERDALLAALRAASAAEARRRDADPGAAGLLRRARGDLARLRRALRSQGYFEGEVEASVGPAQRPVDGASDGAADEAFQEVRFEIAPGPRYRLTEHRFGWFEADGALTATPPRDVAEALAETAPAPVGPAAAGAPARSALILAAEEAALARLRAAGRPYARLVRRDAVIDPGAETLSVRSEFDPGPRVVYGPVSISGAPSVKRDYLAGFFDGFEGRPASRPELAAAQRNLAGTRLFRAAQVSLPDAAPDRPSAAADGAEPALTVSPEVDLVAAPHRSIGGGLSFNSFRGPGANAFWEHRNLFGRAERFRVDALGALNEQSVALAFRKPRFLAAEQMLLLDLELARETGEAFDRLGVDAAAGLERPLGGGWFGTAGAILEFAELDEGDEDGVELSYLIGAPLTARFDGSDDALDPTTGARARASLTPWFGALDGEPVSFQILDAAGSVYRPLDGEAARIVAAARGRIASILGAETDDVPANRRLYGGGGGSVRGYAAQFVGPFEGGEPTGGVAAFEVGAELRLRVTETFGVVPFLEAGYVGPRAFELRPNDVLTGAGLGLRYRSPVGPLRFDLAAPLDRRRADDPIQVYVSIGQAF